MDEILLQVEDLCYSYGQGEQVLKGINFTVKRGERIAVLGSNGAGKSTCFLNMNGVLWPQSGRILYLGKEIRKKDLHELRKNVGIVFQDADTQIIASTVYSEVSFGPMNLKLSREEVKRRVDAALDSMNLKEMKDRPPHYLSGGEKKRVSIADIIAMESQIVIFDEPTASLDPVHVEMVTDVLDNMSKMGKTLLISTHDVDFAYRWADRAVVFAQGTILADGTVGEVFDNDRILEQANLKKPILLQVYDSLVRNGVLERGRDVPRDLESLEVLLKEEKI